MKMVKNEKLPFGYIYRAINEENEKNYLGQTVTSRWGDDKIPIEERWKEEVREAYAKNRRGENLRFIENAIVKYGPESFKLIEQDVASNQEELDRKETHYIKQYDTMNPDKGYNMKEGGMGGRLSEVAKENLSRIGTEKWEKDPEYRKKQEEERKERSRNPEWNEKMTKINQERAKDPEWRDKMTKINREMTQKPEYKEKMRNIMKEKAKDLEWRQNVSKGVSDKYQNDPEYSKKQTDERRERAKNPEWRDKMTRINRERAKDPVYRQKQRDSHEKYKKKIENKKEFLDDIRKGISKKEMLEKYEIGKNSYNKRIQEMFGPNSPKNHTELKDYLQGKDINEVLKEIEERESEERGENDETKDTSEKSDDKTSEKSREEENPSSGAIYKDTLKEKESTEERDNKSVEDEGGEKPDEIKEKPLEEENDRIEEDLSGEQVAEPKEPPGVAQTDESDRQPETEFKESSNKFSSEAFKKLGVERFPDDIKVTSPDGKGLISIKDLKQYSDRNKLTVKWTSGREYNEIPNKLSKDYDGIEQSKIDKGDYFQGIDEDISKSDKDYNRIDDAPVEAGNDFDGIDKPQEKGDKDFNDIDEDYPERGVESGG